MHQSYFNAITTALLEGKEFPAPHPASHTQNHILQEFGDIRKDMDPKVWAREVKALAADLELSTDVLDLGWEPFKRTWTAQTAKVSK